MVHIRTPFNLDLFLNKTDKDVTILPSPKNQILFSQGDTTDAVFYIQSGKVKVTVLSEHGKEAVVAILERGAFLGESCLVGQIIRTATATTLEDSRILRIEKAAMLRMLQEQPRFSEAFMSYLLTHSIRVQEDLVDQLFNSSEKRLARALLLLARYGMQDRPARVVPRLSQETLAEMVGTTRSRVNFFMKKFKKLGFIEYDGDRPLKINQSLLSVVLHD